jgi:hypothetical protein
MADGEGSALGLSVGATNLAAVTAERSVTRKPVLTLFQQRPPEVGVPAENPMLNEPGLVISDFVDRVGDPAGIVAADETMHRSETLVADALRALAYAATDGLSLPDAVAATHPAHWGPGAVDAVRVALGRVSEWSGGRLSLLADSAAALIALRSNPGLPNRGIVAVCDFGGTGTSLSLMDAANGYQSVASTVRHAGLSGDRIDQALLTHVVSDLSSAGSFDTSATSAIGSLTRLRTACRRAKEELSSTTVTTLTADVPGYRGDIRLTRAELDDAIRQPLDGFLAVIEETLQRNGIRSGDLSAVASVGGGASIPTITTALSEYLRVPVITTPRPHLTAAIGAALRAERGSADGQTALAPTAAGSVSDATTISALATESQRAPALAWSEAGDDSGIVPIRPGEYPDRASDTALRPAGPPATVDHDTPSGATRAFADVWYRRPPVVMVGTALVLLALVAAVMIILHHTSGSAPSTPSPSVSTPVPTNQSPTPSGTTATQAPASGPASSTESDTGTPASTTTTTTTTTQAPSTTTTTTTQAPTTTTQPPEPSRRFPGPRGFPRPEPGFR